MIQFALCARRPGITLLIYSMAIVFTGAISPVDADDSVDTLKIAAWVVQLDDDLYATRKKAQQNLELAGLQAMKAVAEEARSGSLESSTRALNIMLAWSESADHPLQIASLENLVTLPNRPIEAGLAAELLADAREQAALVAFTALGGRHEIDRLVRQLPFQNRLPHLQAIIDARWKGELEGLKHLAAMRRVSTVSFYSAPLDQHALAYLTKIPNLQRIEFFGTTFPADAIADLRKKIPDVDIHIRSGALLGIRGDGNRQGPVVIMEVGKDTAAAKAGLQAQDAITELGGEKVKDFTDLTSRIGKFQPGDSVELTIVRDGKQIKKKVTFDRWGNQVVEMPTNATRNMQQRFPAPRKITLERR